VSKLADVIHKPRSRSGRKNLHICAVRLDREARDRRTPCAGWYSQKSVNVPHAVPLLGWQHDCAHAQVWRDAVQRIAVQAGEHVAGGELTRALQPLGDLGEVLSPPRCRPPVVPVVRRARIGVHEIRNPLREGRRIFAWQVPRSLAAVLERLLPACNLRVESRFPSHVCRSPVCLQLSAVFLCICSSRCETLVGRDPDSPSSLRSRWSTDEDRRRATDGGRQTEGFLESRFQRFSIARSRPARLGRQDEP
jgi:hypothetical protein